MLNVPSIRVVLSRQALFKPAPTFKTPSCSLLHFWEQQPRSIKTSSFNDQMVVALSPRIEKSGRDPIGMGSDRLHQDDVLPWILCKIRMESVQAEDKRHESNSYLLG